jgi:hypothetical protein
MVVQVSCTRLVLTTLVAVAVVLLIHYPLAVMAVSEAVAVVLLVLQLVVLV